MEDVPGKVHEEAVEEQADRGEDLEQGTVEKQLESMEEGSPRRSTSNINNRFLRQID